LKGGRFSEPDTRNVGEFVGSSGLSGSKGAVMDLGRRYESGEKGNGFLGEE
jgi:hypothetical protein